MFPYYIFTAYLMRVPNRCSFVAQTKHCIMENTTEITNLQIVRMKDDNENGGWGAAIKRSLMPSQFYVIQKNQGTASSFYLSLVEPTVIYTPTRSAQELLLEIALSKNESENGCHSDKRGKKHSPTGSFNVSDLSKSINVLENRPMWIDNSEIQSVTELCEKCRRMKEEHHIQFAVIDDFLKVLIPQSVWEGREAPDAPYKQLCQLAKDLDIVVVALSLPSIFHANE